MKHLDDEQLTAAIAGLELDGWAREHLDTCLECRRAVEAFVGTVAARRRRLDDDEPDWADQLDRVMVRLPAEPHAATTSPRRWWRPAAAAAAAVVVAGVVVVMGPRSPEVPVNGSELPIAEILAEVDAVLADDSIPGFEVIDPGLDGLEGVIANGSS